MKSLQKLDLSGCSNLDKFPEISEEMEELTELFLGGTAFADPSLPMNDLIFLGVINIREMCSLPSSVHMKSLRTLDLCGCSNLENFPEFSEVMKELTELDLDGTAIKELPSSMNNLTRLCTLDLSGCGELNSLPSSIHMKSFWTLDLSGCSNLEKFPEISKEMEELTYLFLNETGIKELPSSINNLTRLVILKLSGCGELKSLPCTIRMKSLRILDLSGCSNLEEFSEISKVMEKLEEPHLAWTAIKILRYYTGFEVLLVSQGKGLSKLQLLEKELRSPIGNKEMI